jgi:3-hydroxy-3-methylglutaryl CoA synthase
MAGIVAYGAYVPRFRLNRKTISQAIGWLSPAAMSGEKAVANFDEDSLTMGVAAGIDCLKGIDREKVDGLYFATTTAPYREKESAAIMATAFDFRPDIRTADMGDSLKAGTSALLAAGDAVAAGSADSVLVCAADVRLGKPGGSQEMLFGDGAGALLLGDSGVIASLEGSYCLACDFPDYRRAENDKYVRVTEERFIREQGYGRFVTEAVTGLMKKYKLEPKDITKVAFPCLNARLYGNIGKGMGLTPEQLQEPLLTAVGETGAASPVILLSAMLEDANPGDNIIVASYGDGAEAVYFKVTEEITRIKDRKRLSKYVASKKELDIYEKYLVFRGIIPHEAGFGGEVAPTQMPLAWRERKTILALYGSKCKKCGTPQYPAQTICVNPDCGAVGEMEPLRFSDKKATIFSVTEDSASYCPNPPLIFAMIDFEGGGRFLFDVADCDSGSAKVGMPVEMSLRRKYTDEFRGIYGYYWKAVPARD